MFCFGEKLRGQKLSRHKNIMASLAFFNYNNKIEVTANRHVPRLRHWHKRTNKINRGYHTFITTLLS